MNRSDTIDALVTALVKAQDAFKPVFKETENPAFRSKYADLQTIIAATREALSVNGIVVLQAVRCNVETKTTEVETMLAHTSGQWMSDTLSLPATMRERMDAQSVGSSVTYGRRYGLQAMLNIAADIDDDGNNASDVGSKQAAQAVATEKLDAARKVAITPVSETGMWFLWGPGTAFIQTILKSSGTKNNLGMWELNAKDRVAILAACGEQKLEVEIKDLSTQAPPAAPLQGETSRKGSGSQAATPARTMLPGEVDGTLISAGVPDGQKFIALLIRTPMGQDIKVSTFDNAAIPLVNGETCPLFDLLIDHEGKPISAILKVKGKFTNLAGITRLGSNEWELTPDGPLPVRHQERL